jgi:hypothetical protein
LNQLLYKILERCLIKNVGSIYTALNQLLIDADVLPELTFTSLMKQQHGQKTSEAASTVTDSYADRSSHTETVPAAHATGMQQMPTDVTINQAVPAWKQTQIIRPDQTAPIADYQQQLFGAIRQMQYQATQAMPGDAMFGMNGTGMHQQLSSQDLAGGEWVPAGNTGLNPAVATMPSGPVYTRKDIVTALHDLQGGIAQAQDPEKTGVLKAFRELQPGNLQTCPIQSLDTVMDEIARISPDEGDEPKQLDTDDCNTIDLVGMIFEYMLRDENLPDSVKSILSYLHVPYIKVALLDPELFAQPDHPARVLLDRLSEAGALWLNREGEGQFRVFDVIKNTVDQVLSDFDMGIELFERLLRDFDEFINKVKRRIEQLEKLSAQKVEAEKNIQEVKASVHAQIKSKVKGEKIPAPLVAMLLYPWFDYLTSVMLRYGENSEEWAQSFQVIDTLLWSIQPKTTEHELHRLENLKPILKNQIQKGFDTIGYDPVKGAELLEKITELQEQVSQLNTPIKVSSLDTEVIERIEQDTVEREEAVKTPDWSTLTHEEKEIIEKLRLIEFGTWFEFRQADDPDQSQKLKVAWYDPDHLSYLLVNSAGKQVSVMSAVELAKQILSRSASIVAGSAKPFFQRALESIYQDMTSVNSPVTQVPAS